MSVYSREREREKDIERGVERENVVYIMGEKHSFFSE